MDPIAGDRIKGNASGSLQIQYGTRSDLRMYGDVNIVQDVYKRQDQHDPEKTNRERE